MAKWEQGRFLQSRTRVSCLPRVRGCHFSARAKRRLPAVSPGNPAYAEHREDACQFYVCQALNKRSLSMSWKVAESLRSFRVAKGRKPRLMRCYAGLAVAVQDDGNRLEGWASCEAFAGGSHGSPGVEQCSRAPLSAGARNVDVESNSRGETLGSVQEAQDDR